jgi:Ca2+/Na+ antiporter
MVVPIRECAPATGTRALNGSSANATLAASVVVDGDAVVGLVAGNVSKVNSTLLYRTMFTEWDLFDVDQKRVGAIALHLMCIFYAFSGYAIVREQFLEPSLAMLSENLGVATDMIPIIMAAGASAPKLAISVIGTFGTNNDLGIGTVIGSAMFNVLVIISACAFVSKPVSLSWWPLSRDAVFYNFAIVLMTVFIFDGNVNWFESAMLILLYCLYVVVMRYNERISKAVEKQIANSGKPRGGVVEALKIFIDSKIFTAIIYLAIVANVTCIIYEYVLGQCGGAAGDCQGPDKLTWCGLQTKNGLVNTCCDTKALLDNLNHIFNVLFIVEMIIKHIALSLFGYWRDPLNA